MIELDVAAEVAVLNKQHDTLIERYGGSAGAPKPGCMEAAVGGALNGAAYYEDGENILVPAAFALVLIAKRHCYTDGNKRVAWYAFVRWIEMYNLRVDVTDDEAFALVDRLAAADRIEPSEEVQKLVEWIVPRIFEVREAASTDATP